MTGNQDRTARARKMLERLYDRLEPQIDKAADNIESTELTPGDCLMTQRFARAVALTAKAGMAVAALAESRVAKTNPKPQDDMTDNDADDCPEALARMRAELERRLDRVHGLLDKKGLVVEPGCWPVARAAAERVRSS